MDVGFGVQFSSRLNESVDKIVILLTPSSRLFEAEIEIVFQELLVVGPAVENDRKGSVRMNASAKCGQDKLGH